MTKSIVIAKILSLLCLHDLDGFVDILRKGRNVRLTVLRHTKRRAEADKMSVRERRRTRCSRRKKLTEIICDLRICLFPCFNACLRVLIKLYLDNEQLAPSCRAIKLQKNTLPITIAPNGGVVLVER